MSGKVKNEQVAFTCEIVKTRPKYVTLEVTNEGGPSVLTYIVFVKNAKDNRIDFFQRRNRYSYGYGSREFLIQLLSDIAVREYLRIATKQKEESVLLEALRQVPPH
ncbi:MAG: hypothetical protein ACTSO7_13000 [Candidatus Heimdallarchaeota archaeon]